MSIVINKKAFVAAVALFAVMFAVLPFLTFAGTPGGPTQPPKNITSISNFVTVLQTVLGWMFTIFLILAVVMIIWAAFIYLTAGGEEEKLGKAKSILIYAVVAVVVALVAAGLPNIVGSLIGSPLP